jgi:hypothetical protein
MAVVYEVADLYFVHTTVDIYIDTCAGGLLIPESIIRPVDSVPTLKLVDYDSPIFFSPYKLCVTFSYLFHSFTLGLYSVLGLVFYKGKLY